MRFGVLFANTAHGATPEGARALAVLAEELGYESLWTVEHVVVPADYASRYPYSSSGRMPGAEDSPIPDPLVWLTWAAAATSTIRLATGVLILPQRNPVVLAKEVATLDVLSGGRVTLGVGIGWLREEFEAIGVPFGERVARTEEHIEVLRTLWSEGEASFSGRFTRLDRAKLYPRPAQAGGPPIVVGGHSEAAARRAGRLGDGFFPVGAPLEETARLVALARQEAERAGRDPAALEITMLGRADLDGVRRLADLGADRVVVPGVATSTEQHRRLLTTFAHDVMARIPSAGIS